jgi:hypothetical protein
MKGSLLQCSYVSFGSMNARQRGRQKCFLSATARPKRGKHRRGRLGPAMKTADIRLLGRSRRTVRQGPRTYALDLQLREERN